jgi:hypothetical protein
MADPIRLDVALLESIDRQWPRSSRPENYERVEAMSNMELISELALVFVNAGIDFRPKPPFEADFTPR